MFKRLAHACIHTTDLEKTQIFYTDGLGLELGFTFEKDGQPFGFYLKVGDNSFIEVFEGQAAEVGNIKHIAIEVDDLDGLINRLNVKGIDVTDKKLGADHSWQAWVTDPNGVRIEFHEYTEESQQLTGGVCRL